MLRFCLLEFGKDKSRVWGVGHQTCDCLTNFRFTFDLSKDSLYRHNKIPGFGKHFDNSQLHQVYFLFNVEGGLG